MEAIEQIVAAIDGLRNATTQLARVQEARNSLLEGMEERSRRIAERQEERAEEVHFYQRKIWADYDAEAKRRASSQLGFTEDRFRAFLDLLMCSDPWPVRDSGSVDEANHAAMIELANAEAKFRGYDSWVEAFHRFQKGDHQ